MADSYRRYLEAEHYLNEGLIRREVSESTAQPTRREWMLKFLDDLGHPEMGFPAVHVAGTSGKGSTALMIAEALRAGGLRVGLHTSPYLQVATEKLWCDGRYAGAEEFIELVEWIKPICERWREPRIPLHGLASFGICLEYFKRERVDIAVIETGVGGRDDITNVLNTRLAVITPIGIDHTKTLGETIDEIAAHKAGIIKGGIPVVAYRGEGWRIIEETAKRLNAPLYWCQAPGSCGFQEINGAIAQVAVQHLVPGTVPQAHLPGRMELLQEGPGLIIDGAHNAQKLKALFHSTGARHQPIVVLGMLESKVSQEAIDILRRNTKRLIVTSPKIYGKGPIDPSVLAGALAVENTIVEPEPESALRRALEISEPADTILVTGSLYLAGNIRELYYSSPSILDARTSWPKN